METAVDALLADMRDSTAAAAVVDEPFAPNEVVPVSETGG
jgi:hypothetical protein